MFLTILLTGGSPNIYLQDSKARRPAAIAAKGFNPGLGGGLQFCESSGQHPHPPSGLINYSCHQK